MSAPRVGEALNAALHRLMTDRPDLHLLGEDVCDPYGGAFRITRGLSTRFPDRVFGMPISEAAIAGIGNGLALGGDEAVVEVMFGDFVTLVVDQLCNFAAKSVSMYGRPVALSTVVRCPVGGGRGYGPTHSQSLQKHFVGWPNLMLAELSPMHDPAWLLGRLLDLGRPAILFEDKQLYGRRVLRDGVVDDLFGFEPIGDGDWIRVSVVDETDVDLVIVAPGGLTHRAVAAARTLLVEHELLAQVLVPATLYPLDLTPVLDVIRACGRVAVVEDSTAGGTWGTEVAASVARSAWSSLTAATVLVNAPDSIIPSAAHLEEQVTVTPELIVSRILEPAHA